MAADIGMAAVPADLAVALVEVQEDSVVSAEV